MRSSSCHVVKIVTPQQYLLDGLWFGPQQATTGFIMVHGLGSNVFSQHQSVPLSSSTMALFFNNRGHDSLTGIKRVNDQIEKGYDYVAGGQAHEVFTECIDDIQGAVDLLVDQGVQNIYLVGHSTGCQKSIYYLAQTGSAVIKGVVLLCPLSDYAYAKKFNGLHLPKAKAAAQELIDKGKAHSLLPESVWPELLDAQRFLSLYTPNSEEEIFTYSHPQDKPKTLQKVKVPILVILAERDEYGDRPMKKIGEWFQEEVKSRVEVQRVDSLHNLNGKEEKVIGYIVKWLERLDQE